MTDKEEDKKVNIDDKTLKKKIKESFNSHVSDRSTFDSLWRKLSYHLDPMRKYFFGENNNDAQEPKELFDTTGLRAADALSGFLLQSLMPYGADWFSLQNTYGDDSLESSKSLETIKKLLIQTFDNNGGMLYTQSKNFIKDLICYGNAALFITTDKDNAGAETGISFKNYPIHDVYFSEDMNRKVNRVFRRFELKAIDAYKKWGDKLPKQILSKLENAPTAKHRFIHAVLPVSDIDKEKKEFTNGKEYVGVFFCEYNGITILSKEYHSIMPYIITLWDRSQGSQYGYGLGIKSYIDMVYVNDLNQLQLEAAAKAIHPPLLAKDENVFKPLDVSPGSIIMGGLDEQGRPSYNYLTVPHGMQISEMEIEDRRNSIRETFLYSIIFSPKDPNKTATESLIAEQKNAMSIGANISRLQSDFLEPLIVKTLILLGKLQDERVREALSEINNIESFSVNYKSPLANQQNVEGERALNSFAEKIGVFSQIIPNFAEVAAMEVNPERLLREAARVSTISSSVFKTEEEKNEERKANEEMARQQAMQQELANAQAGASAAKDMSQAALNSSKVEGQEEGARMEGMNDAMLQ